MTNNRPLLISLVFCWFYVIS